MVIHRFFRTVGIVANNGVHNAFVLFNQDVRPQRIWLEAGRTAAQGRKDIAGQVTQITVYIGQYRVPRDLRNGVVYDNVMPLRQGGLLLNVHFFIVIQIIQELNLTPQDTRLLWGTVLRGHPCGLRLNDHPGFNGLIMQKRRGILTHEIKAV